MAANTAAENGMKVLLIERKRDITEIQRLCGQLTSITFINVSGKIKYGYTEPLNLEIGTDKTRVHWPALGFSIDYEGPLRPYYNYIHLSPSGYHVYREKDNFFAFFWEKESLLAGLFASAQKAGAEVLTETIGTGAENTPDGVKVFIRGKSGEQTLEAKRLIAADGSSSTIAEGMGLNEKRKLLGAPRGGGRRRGAVGFGYVLEGVETEFRLNAWLCFTVPHISRSNFWMFLLRDDRNMLGGGGGRENVDKLMKLPFYEHWFRHARIVKKVAMGTPSGMVPRGPLLEPAVGNTLVIGDAAALVEATNPGAIACGYMGAKATLKEMNGQSGYQEYTAWWQTACDTNDPEYLKSAGRFFVINQLCSSEEIDYLYQVIQGQVGVPSVLVARNLERIKVDRPELYQRLKGAGLSESVAEMKMDLGQVLQRRGSDI